MAASSFIGRDGELAQIRALMLRNRVVTVAGPGGIGKSRLALEFVARYGDAYPDGSAFVHVAGIDEVSALARAVAAAVALPVDADRVPAAAIAAELAQRDVLVVLDEAECAVPAVAEFVGAAIACDDCNARFLITSRTALTVAGERVFSLGPLAEPARLFVDRALAVRPDLKMTGAATTVVAAVCARLGGIPLAIELAAAQIAALAPRGTSPSVEGFDEHLSAYAVSPETAHIDDTGQFRALAATLEWSYRALEPEERHRFGRIAVFASSFSLAACDAVSGDDSGERRTGALLDALVGKALVKCWSTPEGPRFTLHPVVREFAMQRLESSGDAAGMRKRFCDYYCDVAERLWTHATGDLPERIARTASEWENVRAALRLTLEQQCDVARGVQAVLALNNYWTESGRLTDGWYWILCALEVSQPGPERDALAYQAAVNAHGRGDFTELEALCRPLVDLYEREGRAQHLARALNGLANARYRLGDPIEAEALYGRALEQYRRAGDRNGEAVALMNLGALNADRRLEFDRARAFFVESLAIFSEAGMSRNVGTLLANIAEIDSRQGNHARAIEYAHKSRSVFEQLGNAGLAAWQLVNVAAFHLEMREFARSFDALRHARPALHEGLMSHEHAADYYDVAFMLAADLLAFEPAAKLYGYAQQFRELYHLTRSPSAATLVDPRFSLVANALRGEQLERLMHEGAALDDTAIDAHVDHLAATAETTG